MSDYIIEYIEIKRKENKLKKADILSAADLDYKGGYKYLNGERRLRRNSLIRIVIYFGLTLDETQELFLKSFYPQLYDGDSRDNIIIKGINENLTIEQINEELSKINVELI